MEETCQTRNVTKWQDVKTCPYPGENKAVQEMKESDHSFNAAP